MSESSESEALQLKLRKNGELTITEDNQPVVVAHYDQKTGRLEFSTKEYSEKFYNQAVSRIGAVNKGTQASSLVIRSFGIKGDAVVKPEKNVPKKPKLGPLGDTAENIVRWYLTHALPEAIIRYRIYTDATGTPICKKIRRLVQHQVDNRNLDDEMIQPFQDGKNSQSKAPVTRENELVDFDGVPQIIAGRATALTFTPQEVVGGWTPDDDFAPAKLNEEETD